MFDITAIKCACNERPDCMILTDSSRGWHDSSPTTLVVMHMGMDGWDAVASLDLLAQEWSDESNDARPFADLDIEPTDAGVIRAICQHLEYMA